MVLNRKTVKKIKNFAEFDMEQNQAYDYETGLTLWDILLHLNDADRETLREANALGIKKARISKMRLSSYLKNHPFDREQQNSREPSRYFLVGGGK